MYVYSCFTLVTHQNLFSGHPLYTKDMRHIVQGEQNISDPNFQALNKTEESLLITRYIKFILNQEY